MVQVDHFITYEAKSW